MADDARSLLGPALFDAAPDAFVVADAQGRILLANAQVEPLFGYTPQELEGANVDILVPDGLRPMHAGHRASFMDSPKRRPMGLGLDLRGRRKDGSEVPVDISLSPRRTAQGVVVVAAVRDASGRRRLEAERDWLRAQAQEVEQLRRLDEFRTRFINTAAHELRTPLVPLRSQVHLLLNAPALPPERQRAGLLTLQRNLDRLSRMVEDLLDVARHEAGRLTVRPQATDLHVLVRQAVETYQPVARERGLQVSLSAEGDGAVQADPQRVAQVLDNFLGNAVKFTPRGGRVEVRCREEGDRLRVEVQDTGRGIAPADLGRLFQPFSQVHDPMDVKEPGSGLGLYIARALVRLHGGDVAVESAGPGHGTTVRFVLPRGGPPAAPPAQGPGTTVGV